MRRIYSLAGLLIGSIPGFLLPFLLTEQWQIDTAATFLLAMSTTLLVSSIFAASLEVTLISKIGSRQASGVETTESSLRAAGARGILLFAIPSLLVYAVLGYTYSTLTPTISFAELMISCWPLALVPVLNSFTAPLSAFLFASGRLGLTYATAFLRGAPAVVAVFFTTDLTALSTAYLAGEAMRGLLLFAACRFLCARHSSENLALRISDIAHQVTSNALGQGMPLIAQAAFASSGAAAIAQGAIALRIYASSTQVVVSAVAMPQVIRFPTLVRGKSEEEIRRSLGHDALHLVLWTCSLAALASLAVLLLVGTASNLLGQYTLNGLVWSLPLLLGLLPYVLNYCAGRGLIVAGLSRLLPRCAIVGLILGGITCAILLPLGGLAALWALLVSTVAGAFMTCYYLWVRGPGRLRGSGG